MGHTTVEASGVANLFDSVALYNFLSTFSGTHFVTPRSLQAQMTVTF